MLARGEYAPLSHAVQACEPVLFLYVPASHGRQGPSAGPVCPGPHDAGEEAFAVALEAFAAASREVFAPLAEAFPAAASVLQAEPTLHGETSGAEAFVPLAPLLACAALPLRSRADPRDMRATARTPRAPEE